MKETTSSASGALRAIQILESVARAPMPVGLAALAREIALPKPTVLRILGRLESAGLVMREPASKAYTTGGRLTSLAIDTLSNSPLRATRHRILDALVDEIGETCNCTMPDGDQVIYLDRVETAWPLRMHLQPGSRVPLHCSASGKLFLAFMPKRARRRFIEAAPLPRYTSHTIVEPDRLERELQRIRRERVSFDQEEFIMGMVCMAVPVYAPDGKVIAALALHAPIARMTPIDARQHLTAMRRAADSMALTYRDPVIGE